MSLALQVRRVLAAFPAATATHAYTLDVIMRFRQRLRRLRNGCVVWTGARHRFGYGEFQARKLSQQPITTHVFAWILRRGSVPAGKHVLHECDNPPCCNELHLFLGDQRTNNADRQRKGRTASGDRNGARTHPERVPQGEHNGQAKLTLAAVVEIRALRGIPQRMVADAYGISQQHVSTLQSGRLWLGGGR